MAPGAGDAQTDCRLKYDHIAVYKIPFDQVERKLTSDIADSEPPE